MVTPLGKIFAPSNSLGTWVTLEKNPRVSRSPCKLSGKEYEKVSFFDQYLILLRADRDSDSESAFTHRSCSSVRSSRRQLYVPTRIHR